MKKELYRESTACSPFVFKKQIPKMGYDHSNIDALSKSEQSYSGAIHRMASMSDGMASNILQIALLGFLIFMIRGNFWKS